MSDPAEPRVALGPGEAIMAGTARTHLAPLGPNPGKGRAVTRTYRVQVTGQFADLTPTARAQLRAGQAEHDLFLAAFSAEGTFTYTPTLTRFTLRYLLEVSEDSAAEADEAAGVEGELLATQFLESRSITYKPLSATAVCLDDVKIKGRRNKP